MGLAVPVNKDLVVKRALRAIKHPSTFIWGASGELVTDEVINRGVQLEPKRYNEAIVQFLKRYIDTHTFAYDCIGLVRYCVVNDEPLTTDELFEHATESGTIDTLPEIPGVLLYLKTNHVGIYIGNGEAIESTYAIGVGFGLTLTKVKDRPWTHWFKSHWIKYD